MATAKRSRLTVDERREQLVRLGVEIFSERPYDEVSIDGIAAAAGISKGLLYHYFPSKRDFYVAVVRHGAAQLEAATMIGDEASPEQGFLAGLDRYLDYVEEHASGFAAVLGAGVGNDPTVRAIVDEVRRAMTDRILDNLARRVAPPVPSTPPVRVAVRGWVGFAEAASLDWLEHREVSREQLRELLASTLVAAVSAAVGVAVPS
jgi:AcrR family transcriptional regulator